MPTAYGYIRVSTIDQATSLDVQTEQLNKHYEVYLKPAGYERGRIYQDKGVSGSKPLRCRRQGLEMNLAMQPGDVVVFAKVDRAFRNTRDSLECWEIWDKRGIKVIFLDVNLDTSTPIGKMLMTLLASFAEFERARIRLRSLECRAALRAAGKYVHGPHAPWGFLKVKAKSNKYVRDSAKRDFAAKIIEWHDREGVSFYAIYQHLRDSGIGKDQGRPCKRERHGSLWTPRALHKLVEKEKRLRAKEAAEQPTVKETN